MTDFERTAHDPTTNPGHESGDHVPVAAAPVATTRIGEPRRSHRGRWLAAAALVALVIAATGAVAVALTGASPAATVLGYVPEDSVMYGEVRLDLPGDQRQEVGEFLAKFPGFADQAALDTKLDEVLDRLLSESTDGKQTFTRDIKPWFDGELAFSMGPLPAAAAIDDPEQAAAASRFLALISIKDETLARAWFHATLTDAGATAATETYAATELTVLDDPDSELDGAVAFLDDKVAVFGDLTSVKAAVDTDGQSDFATDERFVAAQSAADGDHIGFFFLVTRALMDATMALTEGTDMAPPVSDALLALVPDWAAGRLRVEGDALVMDAMAPHVAQAPGPDDNRPNAVAGYAPPSTVLLAAGNDVGATALETLALYRQDPTLAEIFTGIDEAAGMIGGLDASLSWMGDTGIVVASAGDGVEGGLVSLPADAAAGQRLLTTLRSLVQFGGGQMGFQVRDEDHGGTTITILDLGSVRSLAGLAGGMGGVAVPPEAGAELPEGNVEIAYAATDEVVVIGSSPDFVRHVLDAGAGESLADGARYQGLVGRVGSDHTAVSFVDVAGIRTLVEGVLAEATAAERDEYEESLKPFLSPFDALVATAVTGSDLEQQHVILTVK